MRTKTKNQVPQYLGFTAEAFNLAGETLKPTPSAVPVILAEMTESDRERLRAESRTRQAFIGEIERDLAAEPGEIQTPGLAPGSAWHKWGAK